MVVILHKVFEDLKKKKEKNDVKMKPDLFLLFSAIKIDIICFNQNVK